MMHQRKQIPHKYLPEGYRHLFNVIGTNDPLEARVILMKTFGHRKGSEAKMIDGHRRGIDVPGRGWEYRRDGFTAFLPLDYKDVK